MSGLEEVSGAFGGIEGELDLGPEDCLPGPRRRLEQREQAQPARAEEGPGVMAEQVAVWARRATFLLPLPPTLPLLQLSVHVTAYYSELLLS